MPNDDFLNKLGQKYSEMLENYAGGLSNTSVSKFNGVRDLFREQFAIENEDGIYAIGSGSRPGNIEVRLSQGIRAFIHTQLGLAFIKAEDDQKAQKLSDSAVVTINSFLERGKATYDSILVLVEVNET